MSSSSRKWQVLQDFLLLTVPPFLLWYVLRNHLLNRDLFKPNKETAKRLENILDRHEEDEEGDLDEDEIHGDRDVSHIPPRRRRAEDIVLNQYEQTIANEVVHPDDIPVSFSDIGGLDSIISDLQESVIYPLTMPSLYQYSSSSLLSAPSGVLLYGPPGCGKTMLAKALAHESGAVFINVHISTLTEKWYGDSNKLVAAVFSLARKLAPAIVFIDELDTIMGSRRSGEHEASGMVKAEMMTHMDGLSSNQKGTGLPQRVLLLGATNRPQDIDEAILRRMPKRFGIGLPNALQRRRILELLLRGVKLEPPPLSTGPDEPSFDIDALVEESSGMSGSDIKEMCREAAMVPVREAIQTRKMSGRSLKGMRPESMRALRTEDFTTDTHPRSQTAPADRHFEKSNGKGHSESKSAPQSETAGDENDSYITTEDEDEAENVSLQGTPVRTSKAKSSKTKSKQKRNGGAV